MLISSPYFIIKKLQLLAFIKYSHFLVGRTLDIGCGVKPYRKFMRKDNQYIGIDEVVELMPEVAGRATELPFSDGGFDGILCTEVLEHLPEPQTAITEIKRVLKKGGCLYITVPQEWPLHYEPNDYFRFTSYGIKYLLEKNGFTVIAIERIGGIFSLVGQRMIDLIWHLSVGLLKLIFGVCWAERISSVFCTPVSLFFYALAIIGDEVNKTDALGWAVLANKL